MRFVLGGVQSERLGRSVRVVISPRRFHTRQPLRGQHLADAGRRRREQVVGDPDTARPDPGQVILTFQKSK